MSTAWAWIAPYLPAAQSGTAYKNIRRGRRRDTKTWRGKGPSLITDG